VRSAHWFGSVVRAPVQAMRLSLVLVFAQRLSSRGNGNAPAAGASSSSDAVLQKHAGTFRYIYRYNVRKAELGKCTAQLSMLGRRNVLSGPNPCIFSGDLKLNYIKGNSSITFVGDNIAVA
jgi:hypothetical protein